MVYNMKLGAYNNQSLLFPKASNEVAVSYPIFPIYKAFIQQNFITIISF